MPETITKIDATTVEIAAPAVAPPATRHKLKRLRADLQQARESLLQVKARQAEERAPIEATIALFLERFNAAKALIQDDPTDVEVTP